MADASLTGLRAVRPRGPRIVLGVGVLALVGGLVWFLLLRPEGPIGAAEDPGRLLVVGGDEAVAAARSLDELGFDATAMTLAEVEAKAREAGDAWTGPLAAMRWADREGIGYVAFERPSELSFGDLEVAPGSSVATDVHRWVVFGVGDLGMPPKATVGRGETSALELPSSVELMRAVFEQERPASTLFAESQLPMEAVQLHRELAAAIRVQGAYGALDLQASRLARERRERLVQAEKAEPRPTLLAAPLEETSALPLPDGGLLLFVRPRFVESELDPSEMRLVVQPTRQLWYHPPGKWSVADRTRCEALRSGVLPNPHAHLVTEPRGRALMFDVGDAWDVWVFEPGASGCAFARAGSVPERDEDERDEALAPDGRVARNVIEGEARALRVHDPRGGATTLELPGCTEVSAPHWVDRDRVVLACEFDPEVIAPPAADDGTDAELDTSGSQPALPPRQVWLYLVNVGSPSIAALPTSSLQPAPSLVEPRPVGTEGALELLLVAPGGARLLGKVRGKRSIAELAAAPPADPATPRPAFVDETTAAPVVALSAADLEVDVFDIDGSGAHDVSPDGRWLAIEVSPDTHVDPHGYDIALVELKSGATAKVIASSERAGHVAPRFTADGRHVVFQSRYPVDIGARLEAAAQILALPGERPSAGGRLAP